MAAKAAARGGGRLAARGLARSAECSDCAVRGYEGSFSTMLPVFRATAVAWVTARYPGQQMQLVWANAAGAAVVASAAHPAATFAVTAATSAATAAASATPDAAVVAAHTAVAADEDVHAAAGHAAFAATKLWSAVSTNATRAEKGVASVIAGSPLWPQSQPEQLRYLWQRMKAALLAANQEWHVWTIWYDDRLDGHVRDEERELAYVRIEEALWSQGPAIVNAEIKRRIEELEPPPRVVQASASLMASGSSRASLSVAEPTPPTPIENVPSAVSFGWTSRGTITVVAGAQNWPVFPFQGGERDHANRLEASRILAMDTARSLRSGEWNTRPDYAETLDQYVSHLPKQPQGGNFLLADAKARIIRRRLVESHRDFGAEDERYP